MKIINFILFSTILLIACGTSSESTKHSFFTNGEVNNGIYTNAYFRMEMPIIDGWENVNENNLGILGEEFFVKNGRVSEEDSVTAESVMSSFLLDLGIEGQDSIPEFHSSLFIIVENIMEYEGLTTARYIKNLRKAFKEDEPRYKFEENYGYRQINNLVFESIKAQVFHDEKLIREETYVAFRNGFAIIITLRYNSREEEESLYKMLDGLSFN